MQCITPIILQQKEYARTIPVPCGKCPACYKRRASQWSFRLMQETKYSETAYFLTLTYDTDFVPITNNLFMSVSKRDVQLFIKRLRKAHATAEKKFNESTAKIKYYAVGEYGGKYKRPHYHILLYNVKLELMFEKKDVLALKMGAMTGDKQFKCIQWKDVTSSKPLGLVTVGSITPASAGYCLKYMSKITQVGKYASDDRQPEFALMSKGIGIGYLTKAMIKWHRSEILDRMYCNVEGKKIAMPRYYKQKIYDQVELEYIYSYLAAQMEKNAKETMSERDLAEAHKAMFRKMHKEHLQNQKF